MIIPALSVRSPWATQIARGEKTTEYRSWSTSYRGPLLICVSRTVPGPNAGNAVCIVDLVDISQNGNRFYHWHLDNPHYIKPFPIRGQLGLFKVRVPQSALKSL